MDDRVFTAPLNNLNTQRRIPVLSDAPLNKNSGKDSVDSLRRGPWVLVSPLRDQARHLTSFTA